MNSLTPLAKILDAEGFSEFAANQVKRYWNKNMMTARLAGRAENTKKAFSEMVKQKLDERDKIVLGKFLQLFARMHFDTGVRLGLMAFLYGHWTKEEVEAGGIAKRVCAECGGDGWVMFYGFGGSAESKEVCPKCDGKKYEI